MSQGWEWHRGRAGRGTRLEEEGVLQAELGDGERAGCSVAGRWVKGAAGPEASQGSRSSREAPCVCTGDREKRRWSSEREDAGGAGEEEQEDGAGRKVEQAPLSVSQGSQGKLQGVGESGFNARLTNMGLQDECREEVVTEELRPQRGRELLAADTRLAMLPLWQRCLTGVQTREALGRHVERQQERSSGTESERQWRFGGGGGEPGKDRLVTEALGI